MHPFRNSTLPVLGLLTAGLSVLSAQQPQAPRGPGGPGGPPGMAEERKILVQFDKDTNGHLDQIERAKARVFLKENPVEGRGPGGPGGRPGGRRRPGGAGPRLTDNPPTAGAKIDPADVAPVHSDDLYDTDTLRTLFLTFENEDWEAELEEFHNTDVEVPAKLLVDGKTYSGVGIHFRGKSSYFMVPAGWKRSLNLTVDHENSQQRLDGYKTLNLLNSNGDGTFMSGVLYSSIARQYIPAPKANLVRVVINGENWGVYVNQQQFNKEFIMENFRTSEGARWKVPGSPRGRGGLDYIGEDIEDYKKHYEMKSGDREDWQALIDFCKKLDETPPEELEAALEPILDIDEALWFLALDCALINSDGYWTRASDYSIYRGSDGRFRFIPHDMNEAFRIAGRGGPPRGRGGPPRRPEGAPGGGAPKSTGLKLDPLVALDDAQKPLRSKLLAVPALQKRYLEKVRQIAEKDLTWSKIGPQVAAHRELISKEVAADTRKTSSTDQFDKLTADSPPKAETLPERGSIPLRTFATQRRAFLLEVSPK